MAPLPSFVQIALCLRVFIMCVVPGAWPELDKATRAPIFAADIEPRNTKKLAPYVFILNAVSVLTYWPPSVCRIDTRILIIFTGGSVILWGQGIQLACPKYHRSRLFPKVSGGALYL